MFTKILAAIILGAVNAQRDCDPLQTDTCGVQMWPNFVDPKLMPADQAQLAEICKSMYVGTECTKNYFLKCPNELKRTFSDPLIEAFTSTTQEFCSGNLGKRILPHGECVKKNVHENFTCVEEVVFNLEATALFEPASERLKLMCCSYLSLGDCIKRSVTSPCGTRAGRNVLSLLQSYAIFLVDKCLPVLSKPETCDLSVLKGISVTRRPRTLLPALIDVIEVAFE